MCIARLLLISTVIIMSAAGAVQIARATEVITLRAGETTGPNAVFAFDKAAKQIVVHTTQVGVAGSRVEVTIDNAKKPAFSHIFTTEECKFGDGGSKCEVLTAYRMILAQFKRGLVARVTVIDAGVMKMDQTVSLKGFAKSLRG